MQEEIDIANSPKVIKRLTLQIPGSTSNLGPGFDTLALALNIYAKITFLLIEDNDLETPFVTMRGEIAEKSLDSDQSRLIYSILTELWKHDHSVLQRMRIIIDSQIPLGYGLGSSASAILSAVWATSFFNDLIPTASDLLIEGSRMEGHPENLAASILGNMVVCARSSHTGECIAQRMRWPQRWKILIVMPSYSLSTKSLRSVLPTRIDYDVAVANLQRAALVTAAVANVDEKAMREALVDKMHEPYRENLVPELPILRRLLAYEPVLGCFLSGAGSSVAVIVHQEHKEYIKQLLKDWSADQPEPGQLLDLEVDTEGAFVLDALG